MNLLPTLATPTAAQSRRFLDHCPEALRRQRDDWVEAFASKLAALGADAGSGELMRLGRSLYEEYDLLDPYQIARLVWRRWASGADPRRSHAAPAAGHRPVNPRR